MSTKDITAEVEIVAEGRERAGMLPVGQLLAPSAELLPERESRYVGHGRPAVQPGSWADLVALRGRAENYFNWLAVILGVFLIRAFVIWGDGLVLLEGVAYLSGGAVLWRSRANLVGAGLVAGGALVGVIDRLEAASRLDTNTAVLALMSLEIALGVRYGLRIRSLLRGETPVPDEVGAGDRREGFTLAKPVRFVAKACIGAGIFYLTITVLLAGAAVALLDFFGVGFGDMWLLGIPVIGLLIVEDVMLIVAGSALILARAGWARAVLVALCGTFALEWWITGLSGYSLTLKEVFFAVYWSFGFVVLASRRRMEEFAEVEGGEEAFTVPQQLDCAIRLAGKLED